ncbi:hypothetical protein [Psychroserpens sp. MEBiC05023]
MNIIKRVSSLLVMLFLMASFSQCSTAQKLERKAPTQFGEVYCQEWIAGVQGAGSGLTIFIPVNDISIVLNEVYFRGQMSKLEVNSANPQLYIGRFKTDINQSSELILSSDQKEEYANKMHEKPKEFPFELKDNECVVSYQIGDKIMYYMISNVVQKVPLSYPSSPRN